MFTRRNEEQLAEIKKLTLELDRHVQKGLVQLERIRAAQGQLADAPSTPPRAGTTDEPARLTEPDSIEPTGEGPEPRGVRGALRRFIFGPAVDLATNGGDPGDGERTGPPRDQVEASSRAPRNVAAAPAVDDNAGAALLAFVHIPKTAGATVISMFNSAYSKREVRDAGNYLKNPDMSVRRVTRPRKMSGRVLAGHVPYGIFREHLPPDTRYMTFLREPVDRVLSHYYRHTFAKDPRVDKPLRRPARSSDPRDREAGRRIAIELLEEALVEKQLPELNNLCTRFLCGHSPLGDLPPSALDDARENLGRFVFIGIQERFDESLALLQRLLRLDAIPYQDRHVSQQGSRPTVDDLSDEQRQLIERCNELDAELYEFALGLFEDSVAAAGDGSAAEVSTTRASQ